MKLIAVIVRVLFPVVIFASALGSEDVQAFDMPTKSELLSEYNTSSKPCQSTGPVEYQDVNTLQPFTGHSKNTFVLRTKAFEVAKIALSITSFVISLALINGFGPFDCRIMISYLDSLLAFGFAGLFFGIIQKHVSSESLELEDFQAKFGKELSNIGRLSLFSFILGLLQVISLAIFKLMEPQGQICTGEANELYIKSLLPCLIITSVLEILASSFAIKTIHDIKY